MAKALASSLAGSAWAKALDQIEIVLNLHFVAQFVVSFSVGQTRFYVFSPSPHLNLYNWSLFKINGLWVSNWERFLNKFLLYKSVGLKAICCYRFTTLGNLSRAPGEILSLARLV